MASIQNSMESRKSKTRKFLDENEEEDEEEAAGGRGSKISEIYPKFSPNEILYDL